MIGSFYSKNVDADYFKNNIDEIKKYDVVDIMSHPAFVDAFLSKSTSYSIERTKEHEILTSDELKKFFEDNNITTTNYRNI